MDGERRQLPDCVDLGRLSEGLSSLYIELLPVLFLVLLCKCTSRGTWCVQFLSLLEFLCSKWAAASRLTPHAQAKSPALTDTVCLLLSAQTTLIHLLSVFWNWVDTSFLLSSFSIFLFVFESLCLFKDPHTIVLKSRGAWNWHLVCHGFPNPFFALQSVFIQTL